MVQNYGKVEQVVLMSKNNQALLQCETAQMAAVVTGTIPETMLRGSLVRIQFSAHQELQMQARHDMQTARIPR